MELRISTADLQALDAQLAQAGRAFDGRTTTRVLMDAAKPLLTAERQEVPVGSVQYFKGSTIVRGKRKGKARDTNGSYRRGGALRQALRLKSVSAEGAESARVIVGASKKRGDAGWRAHFTLYGTKPSSRYPGKHPFVTAPNNYAQRAYNRTIDVVIDRFGSSAQVIIRKILKSAR